MPPPDMDEDLEAILSDMNISSRSEAPKKEKEKGKEKEKEKEEKKGTPGPVVPERPRPGKGRPKETVPEAIFIGAPGKEEEAGDGTGPLDLTGRDKGSGEGTGKLPSPLELLEEGDVDQTAVDENSIMFYIQDLEEDLQEKNDSLQREMERSGELKRKLEALAMELETAKVGGAGERTVAGPASADLEELDDRADGDEGEKGPGPRLKADEAMQKYIASLEDKLRERAEELETEKMERIRLSNEQQTLREELDDAQRSQKVTGVEGDVQQEGKAETRGFELDTLAMELAKLKTEVESRDRELHDWKGRVDAAEQRANKLAIELTNCGPEVLGEAMREAVERMTELETRLKSTTSELDLQRREKDEMLREIETLRVRMGAKPAGLMGMEPAAAQTPVQAEESPDAPASSSGRKGRKKAEAVVEKDDAGPGPEAEAGEEGDGKGATPPVGEERYEWPVRGHDMELIKNIIPSAEEAPRDKDGKKDGAARLMTDYLEARGAIRGERTGVISTGSRPRGTMVYRCECGNKVMVYGNIDGDKYEAWSRCPKCGKKMR